MSLSSTEALRIAQLARLALSPQAAEEMAKQLDTILGYMDKLAMLDTSTIEPTAHVLDLYNVWRTDQPQIFDADRALMFAQAPCIEKNLYVVPKVIE